MSRMVRIDLIDPSPWADLFDHPKRETGDVRAVPVDGNEGA